MVQCNVIFWYSNVANRQQPTLAFCVCYAALGCIAQFFNANWDGIGEEAWAKRHAAPLRFLANVSSAAFEISLDGSPIASLC
jgi:hypothetical protein